MKETASAVRPTNLVPTRTQTGSVTNWTPYYIFAAIAAVVLIAIAIASHGH